MTKATEKSFKIDTRKASNSINNIILKNDEYYISSSRKKEENRYMPILPYNMYIVYAIFY